MTPNSVVIVGAGPVGLALALGLAPHGTPCRLFDRDAEPCVISRVTEAHARTLGAARRHDNERSP